MPHNFDPDVRRALEKWPDVPACYGWLGLDRRGNWLIKGAKITHRRAIEFLGRNYTHDGSGCYFVQNGPQRAYCDLAYTPWIYILDGVGRLATHTDRKVEDLRTLVVDDEGDVLLETEHGIGLLHDRDLSRFIELLEVADGCTAKGTDLAARLCALTPEGGESLSLYWRGHAIPVRAIPRRQIADCFEFEPAPSGEDGARDD